MSDKMPPEEAVLDEQKVSRRKFTGAGVSATVVMTLASKPVLGAQCLSDALSGNLSGNIDDSCEYGLSPGAWKTPGGAGDWPNGWIREERVYNPDNTFGPDNEVCGLKNDGNPLHPNQDECYDVNDDATTLGDTPLGALSYFSAYTDLTLTYIFNNFTGESGDDALGHYLAAMMNVYGIPGYVLGNGDVPGMANLIALIVDYYENGNVPGGYTHLSSYLDTTWT